tara:strand:+ start:1115 stop:1762 length:648 start_codon:yes stop_codon:yes gene_type:complete
MDDQEIEIINSSTRNEKIKNFFKSYLKIIIILFILILAIISGILLYKDFAFKQKIKISDQFNNIVISYDDKNKSKTLEKLDSIILSKDTTYAPLSLYFILENNLLESKEKINQYFDIIINEIGLDEDLKNLNIYKKGLYNSNFQQEDQILQILNPILIKDNPWKSHALFLVAEYYYNKNEIQKSKEFYLKIINLEIANKEIKLKAQLRIQRDFSE